MKKFFAITFLVFLLTACLGNAPTQSDVDVIETVVAGTLTALPSATSTPEPTATPTAEPTVTLTPEPTTVLPRTLYYLATDSNSKSQIYRLGRDGTTITQITFEQEGVPNFDISQADGTIAYIIGNNLISVDANGENRQILVQDPNIFYSLVWSPDGKKIAYGKIEVVLYTLDTENSEVLISSTDASKNWPVLFSPDGEKLVTRKQVGPSPIASIYDFASKKLIPISELACNQNFITWKASDSFFCSGHVFAGGGWLGLWQVNASNGLVNTLIFAESCPPCSPVAIPRQNEAGDLYYLGGEVYEVNGANPSISLVRSDADGITNRITLRPETFNVLGALWVPDGSALLIVQSNGIDSLPTNLVLVPIDPSLPFVTIMADASGLDPFSLHWGH